MIRIALCDDENRILDEVTSCINEYTKARALQGFEICRFESASLLKNALDEKVEFDVFLLDVYIGDEMGTALAKDIRKRGIESPVIFLTTSLEHAPASFETDTLRYLIKPLNPAKLYEALDAALLKAESLNERLIKLKTENGVESVNVRHVMYSEAHAHYQYVILEDGGQIKVRLTVAELYALLMKNGGFVRVGSAYIINLRNIKNVTTSEVHLYNDITIPIPRGKHNEIKKAFWDFQCNGGEG